MALALLGVVCVAAAPQDEAHRLDSLETQRLNQAQAARLRAAPTPSPAPPAISSKPLQPEATAAERALRMREDAAIEAWRTRVAACNAGHRDACRSD